jgi:phosphatidate cytidylyltransferase
MAAPAEPQKKRASSLTLRIISAAVLIPIVVVAVYLGRPWWDALVVLFGGIMIWEWCGIAASSRLGEGPRWSITAPAVALVIVALTAFAFRDQLPALLVPLGGGAFVVAAAIAVTLGAVPHFRIAALWFGLGMFYVLIPTLAIIALRADPAVGLQQIFWIVALVIAADTGAYAAGRSIGGPKLAPRISPSKTWSGLGGGILAAALVGLIAALWLETPSAWLLVGISAGLGLVEQAGDLLESAVKRRFGVKDSSAIIPGHGGVLDRVDGLMAVIVAVAALSLAGQGSILLWR